MKKTTLILMLFCFFGTFKINACSPEHTPFSELLNTYNQNLYIIVEGYFQPEIGKRYAKKLKVTRSSDSSIKIGQEYTVSEYGPFGSNCEMYEMESSINLDFTGKNKPRLLIVYKEQSIDGKLVTPIFWEAGVSSSDNKIVTKKYDYNSSQYISYECTTPLNEVWLQILTGNTLSLEWMKQNNTKTK